MELKYYCSTGDGDYEPQQKVEPSKITRPQYIVGERVRYATGFWGAEQGQRFDSWWPENKYGKIVKIKASKYLLEFDNGSREWANKDKLFMF